MRLTAVLTVLILATLAQSQQNAPSTAVLELTGENMVAGDLAGLTKTF